MKRQASQPSRIDSTEEDPSTWNVSRLKAFLTENGVSFETLTEKTELVACAKDTIQKKKQKGGHNNKNSSDQTSSTSGGDFGKTLSAALKPIPTARAERCAAHWSEAPILTSMELAADITYLRVAAGKEVPILPQDLLLADEAKKGKVKLSAAAAGSNMGKLLETTLRILLLNRGISLSSELLSPPASPASPNTKKQLAPDAMKRAKESLHAFCLIQQLLLGGDGGAATARALKPKTSGKQRVCGKTLGRRDMVFRCLECAADPTCIMCAECFNNSPCINHEYRMAPSGGGMCDCGDPSAWKSQSFCRNHAGSSHTDDPTEALNPLDRVWISAALRAAALQCVVFIRYLVGAHTHQIKTSSSSGTVGFSSDDNETSTTSTGASGALAAYVSTDASFALSKPPSSPTSSSSTADIQRSTSHIEEAFREIMGMFKQLSSLGEAAARMVFDAVAAQQSLEPLFMPTHQSPSDNDNNNETIRVEFALPNLANFDTLSQEDKADFYTTSLFDELCREDARGFLQSKLGNSSTWGVVPQLVTALIPDMSCKLLVARSILKYIDIRARPTAEMMETIRRGVDYLKNSISTNAVQVLTVPWAAEESLYPEKFQLGPKTTGMHRLMTAFLYGLANLHVNSNASTFPPLSPPFTPSSGAPHAVMRYIKNIESLDSVVLHVVHEMRYLFYSSPLIGRYFATSEVLLRALCTSLLGAHVSDVVVRNEKYSSNSGRHSYFSWDFQLRIGSLHRELMKSVASINKDLPAESIDTIRSYSNAVLRLVILKKALACETSDQEEGMNQNDEKISKLLSQPEILQSILWSQEEDQIAECAKFKKTGHRGQKARATSSCEALADGSHSPPGVSASSKSLEKILDDVLPSQLRKLTEETKSLPRPSRDCIEKIDNLFESQLDKCSAVSKYPLLPAPMRIISSVVTCGRTTSGLLPLSDRVHYTKAIIEIIAFALNDVSYINNMSTAPAKKPLMARTIVSFGSNEHDSEPNNTAAEDNAAEEKSKAQASTKGGKSKKNSAKKKNGKGKQGKEEILAPAASTSLTKKMLSEPNTAILSHFCPIHEGHGTTFLVPLIRLLANVLNCFLFAEVTNPTPFLTVRETDDTSTTDSSSVSTAEIITPSDRRAVLLERLLLVCSPFTFNNNNKNNTASLSPTSPSSSLVHQLPSISIHDWIDMPLRAQVLKHQVEDQLWMRDYAEVQRQARLYEDFQPAAVIEMDLFALQVFSAVVGPQNLGAQMLTRYSYVPQHDRHDITQSPTGYAHFLDLVLSIVGDDNKSSCNRRRANANRILRAMATQGPMLHSQLMESINRQVEDEDDEGETQENSQALQEVIQSLTTSDLQRKGTMRKLVKDKSVWANISVYNINWDINDRESALKEYKLLFGSSSSANENGNNKSNNAAAIANSTSHSTEEFPRALLGQHHEALIDPIRALLHTAPTLSTAIYAVLHKAAEIQKQVDLAVAAAKGVTLPKTQYEIEREQMLKQQQQDKKKKGGGAASATNARPTTEQERLAQMLEALRAEVGGMMRGRQERGRGGNRGGARGRRNGNDENEDDDAESATTSSASSSSSEGDSDDDFDWDDVFGDNNDEEEDDEEETEWVNVDNSDAEQEEANDDDDDDDDNDNRFSSDFDDEVETDMNKVVDRAVSVAKSTSSSSTSSSDEDDECDAPADHTTAANKAPSSLAKNNKKKSGQANNNNDSSRKKPAGDSKNKNNKKKMPAPIPFIKVNDTFLLTAIDFLLLSIEDAVAISKEEKVHEKRSAAKTSNSILSTLCGGEGEEHSVSQNAGNDEENCVDDGGVIDFSYFEQWHERVLKANPFNNNMSTTSGTADSENIVQNVSTSFNADFFLPLPELAGRKPHLYSLAKVPVVHSKILTLQTNVPSKRTLQHLIKGAHAAEEINERNGKNTTMPEVQKYRSYYHRYLAKVCRLQQQKEAESAAFDSPRSLFDVLPLLSKYFSLELEAEHPSFVKTTVDKAVAEVYLAKIKKIMTLIANEPKSKDGQDGTNAEDDAESKANAEKEAKAAADRAARIKEKQQLLLARMKKKQERASAAHQIADPTSAAASPTPGPTTSPTGAETDNAESASDALAKAPNMHESLMMKSTEAECCFCRLSDEGGELMWLCHASASSNVSDLRTHRGNEKRFAESYSDPNYTAGEISTLLSIPQSATSLENLPHYVDEKALNLIKRNNNSAVVHDHLKQLKASMGGLLLLSEEEQHDTITCCRDENNNAAVGGSSEASGSHGDRLSLYKYPFVVHRNTNDKNNGDEEETKINKKLKTAEPQSHRLSVSIMTCGHAAHMACVEKHHAYLNQQRGRDIRELHLQRRGFRGMEFLGGAEFCCPICTRIATVLSYIPKMINASPTSASSALLSSSTSSSSNNNNNSTATSYFDSHLPSAEGCFGEWVASSAIGNNPDAVRKRILETVAALPPKIALSKADENMSNKTFSDFIKINKNIFEKVAPMFSSALCRPYKALVTESASGFSRSADQNPIDERRVDAWTRILNFAAIRAVETEAFTHDLSRITIAEEEKKEEKGEESKKLLQQPLTGPTAASEVVANLPPAYLMNIVNFGLSMADNVCLTLEGKIKLSQEHSTSSRVSFALNEISPQIISNLATMMTTFSVCLFDENGSTIIGNATGDALDNYYYQRFSGQSVPSSPSSSLSPSSPSAVAVADVEITTEGTNHHQHNRHLPVSTRAISIFTKIIETFVQHKPLKIIVSEREEAKRKYLEQALLAKKRLSGGDKDGAVEEAGTDSQNSNESDNKQQSGDNKPEEDKKSAKTAATPIAPTATPPPAASMYYKYNPDVDSAAYGSVALPPIDPIDLYSILSSFTLAVAAEEAKRSIVGFAAATASCSSSASSTIAPVTLSADLITNCLSSHVEAAVADLTSESTFIPFLESVVNALTFVFPEATISAETKEDATNGGMPCVEGKEKEEDTDHAHAPNSILIMKGKEKTMVSTLWHFLVQLSLFKHILTGTAPPPTPVGVIGAHHHHHQSEMSDRDKELVTKPVAHGAYLLPLGHEGSHVHNQTHEKNEKRHQQQLQQEEEEIAIAKTKVLALLEHLCPQLLANTKALLLSSSCSQETTQSTKGDGSAVKALLMTLRDQISRARNSDDKKSIAPLSAVAASFLAASYPLLNNNTKSNESTTNTVAIATPDNDNAGVDVAISSGADANKQKALITGGAPFTTTSAIIAPILPEIICGELTIVEATKARCTDFIYLPRTYHAYIRHLTTLQNCSSCGAANPTFMCLKCQQLLCLRPSNGVPEVMRHAQTCGGGVGIFIMLRSSDYIVVSGINERASQNKPVYVDRYGEYDQELSRGVALNLNAKYVATDLLVPLITNTWDHDNPSLMKAFRNGVKRL